MQDEPKLPANYKPLPPVVLATNTFASGVSVRSLPGLVLDDALHDRGAVLVLLGRDVPVEVVERHPAGELSRTAEEHGGGTEEGFDVVSAVSRAKPLPYERGGLGLSAEPWERSFDGFVGHFPDLQTTSPESARQPARASNSSHASMASLKKKDVWLSPISGNHVIPSVEN